MVRDLEVFRLLTSHACQSEKPGRFGIAKGDKTDNQEV